MVRDSWRDLVAITKLRKLRLLTARRDEALAEHGLREAWYSLG